MFSTFNHLHGYLLPQIVGMREILSSQASNDQDPNQLLSARLCEQLVEATPKGGEVFREAMLKASALLIIRTGE